MKKKKKHSIVKLHAFQTSAEIIHKIFKGRSLPIIIKYNLKIVACLDATLNLNNRPCGPLHKLYDEATYIHIESNHHPLFHTHRHAHTHTHTHTYTYIIKTLPILIEKRLSCLSSTKETFENLKEYDEQRVKQCQYNKKLNYTRKNQSKFKILKAQYILV